MRLPKGRVTIALLVILPVITVFLFSLTPRCEIGTSAVYKMTHWISFASVSNPVTVKMLVNAESRPYLALIDAKYSPTPKDIQEVTIHFRDGDQGQCGLLVTWVVDRPLRVTAEFTVAVHETRFVSPRLQTPNDIIREEFLESTRLYPVNDSLVRRIAADVSDGNLFMNSIDKAKAAYDWVRENIQYDPKMADAYDVPVVLREKRGVCEGFAYAFSTLCRAMGVPARVYYGKIIEPSSCGIFWKKHCWAEFWDGSNWQPVDPTLACFGSLSIHPRIHGSFGIVDMDARSKQGIVWPVSDDGGIVVSGCGLDWSKFVGYSSTVWMYVWLIIDHWMLMVPFSLFGATYLDGKESSRQQILRWFSLKKRNQ